MINEDTQNTNTTAKGFGFIKDGQVNPEALEGFIQNSLWYDISQEIRADFLAELFLTIERHADEPLKIADLAEHALESLYRESQHFSKASERWRKEKASELLDKPTVEAVHAEPPSDNVTPIRQQAKALPDLLEEVCKHPEAEDWLRGAIWDAVQDKSEMYIEYSSKEFAHALANKGAA